MNFLKLGARKKSTGDSTRRHESSKDKERKSSSRKESEKYYQEDPEDQQRRRERRHKDRIGDEKLDDREKHGRRRRKSTQEETLRENHMAGESSNSKVDGHRRRKRKSTREATEAAANRTSDEDVGSASADGEFAKAVGQIRRARSPSQVQDAVTRLRAFAGEIGLSTLPEVKSNQAEDMAISVEMREHYIRFVYAKWKQQLKERREASVENSNAVRCKPGNVLTTESGI